MIVNKQMICIRLLTIFPGIILSPAVTTIVRSFIGTVTNIGKRMRISEHSIVQSKQRNQAKKIAIAKKAAYID